MLTSTQRDVSRQNNNTNNDKRSTHSYTETRHKIHQKKIGEKRPTERKKEFFCVSCIRTKAHTAWLWILSQLHTYTQHQHFWSRTKCTDKPELRWYYLLRYISNWMFGRQFHLKWLHCEFLSARCLYQNCWHKPKITTWKEHQQLLT